MTTASSAQTSTLRMKITSPPITITPTTCRDRRLAALFGRAQGSVQPLRVEILPNELRERARRKVFWMRSSSSAMEPGLTKRFTLVEASADALAPLESCVCELLDERRH